MIFCCPAAAVVVVAAVSNHPSASFPFAPPLPFVLIAQHSPRKKQEKVPSFSVVEEEGVVEEWQWIHWYSVAWMVVHCYEMNTMAAAAGAAYTQYWRIHDWTIVH